MLDHDELTMLDRTIRAALTGTDAPAADAALVDLGWPDLLAELPGTAVSLVFGAQGECGATSGALDDVVLQALGLELGQAVVGPRLGQTLPPATATETTTTIDGLAGTRGRRADRFVVPVRTATGIAIAEVDAADAERRPIDGLDPALELVAISAETAPITALVDIDGDAWARVVADVRLALAHEMVGAARAMLTQARDHAVDREQFGQPIARFQAVRHRLAETLVSIEGAAAAIASAVDFPGAHTAALAKASAGEAGRTAGKNGLQVLAGIGFTSEHPFHPFLRRANMLDALWGRGEDITAELGAELLRTRQVPRLVDV